MSEQGPRERRWAAELAGRQSGCPDADLLRRFHDGALGATERQRLTPHVRDCPACSAALEFLGQPEQAAPAPLPPAVARHADELASALATGEGGTSFARSTLFRAAAGILLAAALGIGAYQLLGPDRDGDLGSWRGEEPLRPLAPVGIVETPPTEMRWTAHPSAASYRVVLLDAAGREIWRRATEGGTPWLALSPDLLAPIVPRRPYRWRVEALDTLGAVIDRSSEERLVLDTD